MKRLLHLAGGDAAVLVISGIYLYLLIAPLGFKVSPGDAVPVGDPRLNLWALDWQAGALPDNPMSLFDGNAFHPAKHTIALSEHMFSIVLLYMPVKLLSGNPMTAYNVCLLMTFPLLAWTMYRLTLALGFNRSAAVAAALIMTFNSYRLVHAGWRLQLLHIQWLIAGLWLLAVYLRQDRRRALFAATGCFVLNALTSWYNAVLFGMAWGCVAICRAGTQPAATRRRMFAAMAAAGAVVTPFALPYIAMPTTATHDVVRATSMTFKEYLTPPYGFDCYRSLHSPGPPWSETSLFIGFLPLLLGAAGVMITLRNRRREPYRNIIPYLLAGAVGLVLSLGPVVDLGAVAIPLPYKILQCVPGISGFRVPARFSVLLTLGIALSAAASIHRLGQRSRWRRATLTILAVLLPLEFHHHIVIPPAIVTEWPEDDWVRSLPPDATLAYAPDFYLTDAWWLNADYMLRAVLHGHAVANGYSRTAPAGYEEMVQAIHSFPDRATVLRDAGIDYLVVHFDRFFMGTMEHFFTMPYVQAMPPMERSVLFYTLFLIPTRTLSAEAAWMQSHLAAAAPPPFIEFPGVWVYDLEMAAVQSTAQEDVGSTPGRSAPLPDISEDAS
ncbi:hypothetical protein JW905_08290 [bacterium]|nr:hypothetical protein [candidate division CSSED10-310 bacterium]